MSPAGARFSPDRRWRTLLWRCWDERRPVVNFIMLNPSTADEVRLDPSCSRARDYAARWGYGALLVTNVFAWRSTDPAVLASIEDPVGRGNDAAIVRAARRAQFVVCAWGNHGALFGRSAQVRARLREAGIALHVLRLTGRGEPAHPLYLPGTLRPRRWR